MSFLTEPMTVPSRSRCPRTQKRVRRRRFDTAGCEVGIEVDNSEAEQPADFELGDPLFGDEAANVAVGDVEVTGRLGQVEGPLVAESAIFWSWIVDVPWGLRLLGAGVSARGAHLTSKFGAHQVHVQFLAPSVPGPGHIGFLRTRMPSWAIARCRVPAARALRTLRRTEPLDLA